MSRESWEISQMENMMDELLATTWYAFEKDGGMYGIVGKYSSEEEAIRNARNPLADPECFAFVISAEEFLDLADGIRKDMDKKLQTELLGY